VKFEKVRYIKCLLQKVETREKMGEAAQVKISDSKGAKPIAAEQSAARSRVRVSPGGYFSVLFFATFAAGFVNYLGYSWQAVILAVLAWTVVPALLWFDRIEFDGKYLTRTGFAAVLRRVFGLQPLRLKVAEIEHIESQSLWTLKSGGRVYFRYSTEISGNNLSFVFASGGKSYRQMIQRLFPLVAEEKLDVLSAELRDYLIASGEIERKTAALKLPSADVLDNTLPKLKRTNLIREARQNAAETDEPSKAVELRQAANELRIAGNLSQAIEAFRRALLWQPENAGLLHDFARGLYTYANAAKSVEWLRRSRAALRLAARRGDADADLMTRIGESFLQVGNVERAAKAFRRALELQADNFRAECGLAEIGLQDGKLAHVVHHYQAAGRAAEDAAAKRWAQTEADYFSLLSNNEDYMDAEISRINWLTSTSRARRACWRLTFVGLLIILLGSLFNEDFAAVGWALSAGATMIWAVLSIAEKVLNNRSSLVEDTSEE
jgi:tetratricopeptide (TPR) repeat protein